MNATHIVSLGGERHEVNSETFQSTCDALVAKYSGIPKVEPINAPIGFRPATGTATIVERPVALAPIATPTPAGVVSAAGKARSEADFAAAAASGFAPKQSIYARGTRVIELGVENARQSRLEFERKPLIVDACRDFEAKIASEHRRDVVIPLRDVRMASDGAIVREADKARIGYLSAHGFGGLLGRTGIGGREYLERCSPRLRAINLNNWFGGIDGLQADLDEAKLRVRGPAEAPEIFGVVSKSYASFDVDKIAASLRSALDQRAPMSVQGSRGSVTYDGVRARFEALFQTSVTPDKFVAGEFFRAGVVVRSRDDGSGSCVVQAVVWQNLCLNLIVIDEAVQETARLRHVGSVSSLARRFNEAFRDALGAISHFTKAWGYACEENVLAKADAELAARPAREVLAALFNGVIERELVPVRGRRPDVVRSLLSMYDSDVSSATRDSLVGERPDPSRGVSRAAVANAFTRWAHEVNADPWLEDEVQSAAGRLLLDPKRRPLPFEPISLD